MNFRRRYQREILDLCGVPPLPVVEPTPRQSVTAGTLVVPSIPNPDLVAPRWTTDWLRKTMRPTSQVPTRRIYVTRGSARNTRRVVNERQVTDLLRRWGFLIVDPGGMTVQEQIDVFASADVIVGPHGAGLTNLVFAPPGVRVLELFAPRYVNPCYWAIANNVPDSHYRYIVCGPDRRPQGAAMQGVLTDIVVDLRELSDALDALLAQGPGTAKLRAL